MYRADDSGKNFDVVFAASFFIIEIERDIIAYIETIKTKDSVRKQGIGKSFIADLVEFIQLHLTTNAELKKAFIIIGQSRKLSPH